MKGSTLILRLLVVVVLSAVVALVAAPASAVTLIEDGQAKCTIIVPTEQDATIQAAADDLQYHLRKMSGAEVPIVSSVGEAKGVPIYLRLIPEDTGLPEPLCQLERYYPDGFIIRANDRRMMLASPRPEGVANAVYGLLEDHLGCHWFTPGEIGEYIPKRDTVNIEIPGGYELQKPSLELRSPWYNGNVGNRLNDQERTQMSKWRTRNRAGGMRGYGGHIWHDIFPKSLQEQEPDLAPFYNGKRNPGGGQICMSNPRAVEIAARFFINLFTNNPGLDHYSFTQNDGAGWCECEKCQAMASNNGARMLILSNRVAEKLAEVHPDKRITILPYDGTIEPPEEFIEGHRNLAPIICSSCMEQIRPKTDDSNSCNRYRRRVERWMTMLPRAWSYDYIGWYPGPWPLFTKLQGDQDYYRSLGYTGIMDEYLGRDLGTDIHMWLSFRIAWDENLKVADLLDEFYLAYFGAAADEMRSIYEMFEEHMLSVGGTGEMMDVPRLYPMAMIETALNMIAEAKQKVADNPTIVSRIERDKNSLRLTNRWLNFWSALGKFRRSGSAADRQHVAEAGQAYLDFINSLDGTLTVGGVHRFIVQSELEDLNDPGTYFAEPGEFSYKDGLNDGGKSYQAKSRSGFVIGTYGLYLEPNQTGEVIYDIRAGEGLSFKDARLVNMYLFLPEGGHNRVEVSLDQGQSWTAAYEDVHMHGGMAEYDLTEHITGANQFLLKFWIQNTDKEIVGMDHWGIKGRVE